MKPRRDITLGEMQDECRKHNGGQFATNDTCLVRECTMRFVCPFGTDGRTPANIDLTDPPRFNEAQMALLKALKSIGVERIMSMDGAAFRMLDSNEKHVSLMRVIGLTESETLDLAELLGKDGT